MDSEEVWEKFLPRTRKGNCNSSLSQMSTSSCFSKGGRLSLSTRANVRESWKVGRLYQEAEVTPPRPSTSKKSCLGGTPRASPKTGTPSTARKSSTKKSIPSDGKTQKSLLSYFSSSSKKSDSFEVRMPEVVEITLDSGSEEENVDERIQDRSIGRKNVVSFGVSRVLFPSTSTAADSKDSEKSADAGKTGFTRDSDKENRLSTSGEQLRHTERAETVDEDSVISTDYREKNLCKLAAGDSASGETAEKLQMNLQTAVLPPAPVVMPPTRGADKGNRVSLPHSRTNCTDKATEKGKEAMFVFKKKTLSESPVTENVTGVPGYAGTADQQATIASPAGAIGNEVHSSAVGPFTAPPVLPVVNQLETLFKNVENQPKLQDSVDKGKKKMNTFELPKVSRDRMIYNGKVTNQTGVCTQQSTGNTCHDSAMRKESHSMPLTDITHYPRRCTSLHEPSLQIQKYPALNDPIENFTGVTECFSLQSSGDLWTPRDFSSLSSDDFDDKNGGKAAGTKKPHRREKNIALGGNSVSKIDKSKVKTPKNPSMSKPLRKDRIKTPHKKTNRLKSVSDVSEVSSRKSFPPKSTAENISSASERESFSNSGGFFQDSENLERPIGQAFVIRTPSVEYLQNYSSFDDTSIAIEKDIACGDSESEKSSVLAYIKDVDIEIANSTSDTVQVDVDVDDKTSDSGSRFEKGNFSASTVAADSNVQNLNYQGKLRGVTLTESEWDRLPSQSNENQTLMMRGFSVGNTCESLASTPVNYMVKNGRKDFSFSSQSEMMRVKQASQDLLSERAASPNEAEEAPCNGVVAGSGQGACQQRASNRKIMSPYSHGMSSRSTEIWLSSAIEPMPPPELNRNVSPNKEDYEGRLVSRQKVLDWMSKYKVNPGTSHGSLLAESPSSIGPESTDKPVRVIEKANEVTKNGVHDCNRAETDAQHSAIASSETTCINLKGKSCEIECRVQVLITSTTNPEGLVVVRKECVTKNKCHDYIDRFRNASAVLTTEVFEIPNAINIQAKGGNSKIQHSDYPNMDSISVRRPNLLQSHHRGSSQGHKISLNTKAVYGRWGWEELDIECRGEEHDDSDGSSTVKRLESSNLSFQKVCIQLCKCSRSMLVECFVLHNVVEIERNSVRRSKFHTSLKDYESCWGVPDDPVTLSAIVYSKMSRFNQELIKNNARLVNPSYDGEKHLPDSLSQVLRNVAENSQEAVNEPICQDRASRPRQRRLAPVRSEISQLLKSFGDSSFGDLGDTISTDSSDLEWLTQGSEESKIYAVDQWKCLMKKMRDGGKSSTSKSALSRLPDPVSSSFTSTTSQGTYSEYGSGTSAGYARERKPKVCPFYKKIQGTRFAVDAFNFGCIQGITHYFLSHFHYDHYIGLNKGFSLPIYCSSVTAKLVVSKLRVNPNLIRRIDPGQTIKVDGVLVTALDANHCPGSLMLLFQLPGGATHLHVGDFRAHIGMESFQAFWNVHVNDLYLDTTYCNPRYTFSSQERVIDNVLSIVESAISKDPKTLIVCGSYTIGKERVFSAIREKFKFKIWAPPDKRRVLEMVKQGLEELSLLDKDSPDVSEGGAARELNLIGALNMLTMVKEDAQVHVLPMAKINQKCLKDHLSSINNFTKIVAFRPTGWAHGRMRGNCESNLIFNSPSVKIYEVPYSEHSSFLELARFVKFIKPERVVKTVVGSAQEREAMDVHINSWLKEARSKVPLPNRSCESPKSSQVATKQREAGDFFSKRKNNLMGRKLSTSQGSVFKVFGSGSVQHSFESNSIRSSDFGSKQTEDRTSCQSQLLVGARKRVASPISREMTPKKRFK